ncbi:MAG: ubiquitin-like domain-containing protein [Anaerolineae bacterium]|nr:ubiquitin-like domain-containing protein [Anaerolineae bacterium]
MDGNRARAAVKSLIWLILVPLFMTLCFLCTREVTLIVDGRVHKVRVLPAEPQALLQELGLGLALSYSYVQGEPATLVVTRPIPVEIYADGSVKRVEAYGTTIEEALNKAKVTLKEEDEIFVNGEKSSPGVPLAVRLRASLDGFGVIAPVKVLVRRAVPITIVDNGVPITIYTTAKVLGEALYRAGLILYAGDVVVPELHTPVSPGLKVYITRSKAARITVDGRIIKTRTLARTVAELMAQEKLILAGRDYTIPPLESPIFDGIEVKVVRVKEEILMQEEPIPYETHWKPDESMELDTRMVVQEGKNGILRKRYRVIYENGEEKERKLEDQWVAVPPVSRIIAYGTKIVIRELETPEGTIKYWRRIRMLATSYTAATAGKTRDHPLYGITRMGLRARKGIVAVDPKVVNLGTWVYVPGYGVGFAADTGGKIKGRRIDLCYDEDNLVLWYKWVDVYLLAPPPPPEKINWVIPDWPKERRRR